MSEDSVEKYGLNPAETMILEDYREKMPIYERLRDFVCDLLKKKVAENNIYVTAVEARIKAEASLAEKLERKNGKYKSLTDLTDILGARVIAFYNDDVDKIAALVESLFKIDWKNTQYYKLLVII